MQTLQPRGIVDGFKNAALVTKACRIIEASDDPPSLESLACAIHRSPAYFHRLFKAITGLTPKNYTVAARAQKVLRGLAAGSSVTEAIYDAGFNSSGRFYERSTGFLGMTPLQYRSGAPNERIRFGAAQTSLGTILGASTARGVAAALLGDDSNDLVHDLRARFPRARLTDADPDYQVLVTKIVRSIAM